MANNMVSINIIFKEFNKDFKKTVGLHDNKRYGGVIIISKNSKKKYTIYINSKYGESEAIYALVHEFIHFVISFCCKPSKKTKDYVDMFDKETEECIAIKVGEYALEEIGNCIKKFKDNNF